MKKIMQFRYFGNNSLKNYPENITHNSLVSGEIFNSYIPITQLGIQASPGTIFYLNNNTTNNNSIIMGNSGLYELNLEGIGEINEIHFNEDSIAAIHSIPGGHLIVDIIYEEG